jgi:hypothetical protein
MPVNLFLRRGTTPRPKTSDQKTSCRRSRVNRLTLRGQHRRETDFGKFCCPMSWSAHRSGMARSRLGLSATARRGFGLDNRSHVAWRTLAKHQKQVTKRHFLAHVMRANWRGKEWRGPNRRRLEAMGKRAVLWNLGMAAGALLAFAVAALAWGWP